MNSPRPIVRIRRFFAAVSLALISSLFLAVGAAAGTSTEDYTRMTRLMRTPITLFPDFDVAGSRLVPLLNAQARDGDAVVISSIDAFKGDFRVEQLKFTNPALNVWLYVRSQPDLRHAWRRQVEGIRGVVLIPDAAGKRGALRSLTASIQRLHEETSSLGMELSVGLEEPDFRLTDNAAEIARAADIVTIYLPGHIRSGGEKFSKKFHSLVESARAANPKVKIELAIPTGATPAATRAIAGLVFANIDLVDRIAIYCRDTADSLESVETLFAVFRPLPNNAS